MLSEIKCRAAPSLCPKSMGSSNPGQEGRHIHLFDLELIAKLSSCKINLNWENSKLKIKLIKIKLIALKIYSLILSLV